MSQSSPAQDKRIYILSQEAPVRAVIKLGVPLIAEFLRNGFCGIGTHGMPCGDCFLNGHHTVFFFQVHYRHAF